MKAIITIKNENRKAVMEYLQVKADLSALSDKEQELKKSLSTTIQEMADACSKTASTDYSFASLQVQGKVRHVVCKVTHKKGGVDWKKVARDYGISADTLERYRKDTVTQVVIDWATDKQEVELCEK